MTTPPNVVFIIADQHRWDYTGYEGNGVTHTPHLDRIARAGTRFGAAYCTSPLCCPSRAAIASGRYGMDSGCYTNLHELPPRTPTFVGQFRDAGYRTCAVGKTHMEIHAYDSDLTSDAHRAFMDSLGWDEVCEVSGNGMLKTGIRCAYSAFLRQEGAFDDVLAFYRRWHYFMDAGKPGDPSFVCHEWPFDERLQETAFIGQRAVEWLGRQDGVQPFFLHLGFAAPHSPIEPLPAYMDLYREQAEPAPWGGVGPPAWLPDGRRGYRAMISQVDRWVGAIYDRLAEKGMLDNTVVLYTADHGEMAGDLGRYGKTCFYDPSVRVPLVLAGPGMPAGVDSNALIELVDLGRTLCDLCAVEPHALDQGRSLAPLLRAREMVHRETVYAEMGCDRMLYDGRYKLMWGEPASDTRRLGRLHLDKPVTVPPSPPRLYDLHADPHETEDLAEKKAHQDLLQDMVGKLLARINENTQTQPLKSRGEYRPL